MYAIITLPTAAEIISSTTAYSGSFFTEFLPLIYLAVGIAFAVLAVLWIRRTVTGGASRMFGGRRGGRGRRRR